MKLNDYKYIYFIGIGGIGMSALARYFKLLGKEVLGYDKVKTPITNTLEAIDIAIHFDENTTFAQSFNVNEVLVVYTPAIPKTHKELTYFQEKNYAVVKRSEVLGLITKETICLAVAGTHGKTSTSSILAHILAENNISFSAFLGGIAENYNSNLIVKGNKYTVVEADEFDRSFLKLFPDYAVVTAMDPDHLDIYGTEEKFIEGFKEFVAKLPSKNRLVAFEGLPLNNCEYYGFQENNDFKAENVRVENGLFIFDLNTPKEFISNIILNGVGGKHNIANALGAASLALKIGVSLEGVKKALANFKGIQRRFSLIVNKPNCVYIDDYAHHPTEIKATLSAVKQLHPNKKITVIFQPHLYSRTQDFMEDFATELSKADELILLPIYPAREIPIEGVTSSALLEKIENKNKVITTKKELFKYLKQQSIEVLVTMGAGNISEHVQEIKDWLTYE